MTAHQQNVLAYYMGLEWFIWVGQSIMIHRFNWNWIECIGFSVVIGMTWFRLGGRLLTHVKGQRQ